MSPEKMIGLYFALPSAKLCEAFFDKLRKVSAGAALTFLYHYLSLFPGVPRHDSAMSDLPAPQTQIVGDHGDEFAVCRLAFYV